MKITYKRSLFFLLMVLLCLPAFQHITKVFDDGELSGDFVLNERPPFSWDSWMDGSFQANIDRYTEDHIGFRNFFVRLNNQIDFSFFKQANADGVVVGKNNYLYEYDYIRAFTGEDFIGKDVIDRKMSKVKYLQDFLKKKFDIDFILIFEPGKARTLPQYIPDSYLENGLSLSNYEYFTQSAQELDVEYIDLNKLFVEMRDTIQYPLYPIYGIHWAEHCMSFVTDTLINYIEKTRHIDMPEFEVRRKIVTDSLSDTDYDIGKTCNLLFQLPQTQLPYPFFTFIPDSTKERPMVLSIADSYYWNIFNTRVPENLFGNTAFWYFNAKVYPDFYFAEKWTRDLNLKEEVEKQDVIILSITERFLYKFAWMFVDKLYEAYTPNYSGDIVERYEDKIRNYSTWFDELCDSAKLGQEELHSIIHRIAYDEAFVKEPETFLTWYGLEQYKKNISHEKSWNDSILAKAKLKNISYDAQLSSDASWIFKNEQPEIFSKYQLIKSYSNSMLSDLAWSETIRKKAISYRMPFEEMVAVDAEYMATKELQKETPFDRRVRYFEELIRKSPEWLDKITKKAKEKNIALNKMIHDDAIYMANLELKK